MVQPHTKLSWKQSPNSALPTVVKMVTAPGPAATCVTPSTSNVDLCHCNPWFSPDSDSFAHPDSGRKEQHLHPPLKLDFSLTELVTTPFSECEQLPNNPNHQPHSSGQIRRGSLRHTAPAHHRIATSLHSRNDPGLWEVAV